MRILKSLLPALVVATFLSATLLSGTSYAVTPDRISGALTSGRTVTLHGNVHHKALPQYDQGPADPSLRFGSMTLLTTPSAAQIKALQALLAQQQDPKSPKYHQWITPEQWADRYGLSQNDVAKISAWLKLQGFAVGNVARGRNWITFSGTAAQVEAAFGTEIHRYKVDGEMHIANAHAPKVPALLAGIVTGIRGLNDFRVRPNVVHRDFAARPYYSSSSVGDVVAPGDIATIYDIHALYNASTPIDGTGQRLAVIGQTDIYLSDLVNFRTGFGLSSISCTTTTSGVISACNDPHLKYVFVNDTTTTDPLVPVPGDLSEADLDLEMSGATARNAQLVYVNAPFVSNGTTFTGGVWDAWYWAVDKNLAPVISMSYGLCEFFDNSIIDPNTGLPAPDEIELMKANSLGITFVNSTGDFGAAECDSNSTLTQAGLATQGVGVGYPASSPEVTGVGGTAIPLTNLGSGANAGTYWGTTNGTDGGSVLSVPGYIPEQAWNDDDEIGAFCAQNPSNSFCSSNGVTDALSAQSAIGVSSTGGGASNCATQDPTFSTCLAGFPQPTWQAVSIAGQSSARFSPDVSLLATPNFPGYIFCTELSELGVAGSGSSCAPGGATGIVNALALSSPSIIGGTSASAPVFAGIVTLMNQYLNGSSAAGLGNINPTLYALAQTTSNAAFHPVTSSSNQVYCVGNTPSGMASTLQCPITGLLGFLGSSADTTTSYNLVTGLGSIDANKLAIAWKQFSTHASFKLSPNTTVLTAVAGAATNSTTITITPQNGFTGTVTFACSNPPSGTTCNFTPTTSASSTSLSIQTTSGMSNLQNASIIVTGTSGAVSSSATVSLAVTGGTESFSLQSNLGSGGTLALVAGASGVVNLGVSSTDGFVTTTGGSSQTALPVTYACTGLPSASQCTFTPAAATQSVSVTLNVATTAPTASLRRNGDRNGIFYAALLPGLLGIVFTFTSRKRALRRLHLLTLVVALGFSTMWMASCGGGSSGSHGSPGTPKGSYPITVNATTSGGPSSSTSFTLQVN